MKKIAIKTYGKIVAFFLSIVGILVSSQSCGMYGTPSADFIVKGKVTDALTDLPIQNIRVVMPYLHSYSHGDTVYTNAKGEYAIKQFDFPVFSEPRLVISSDVDGDKNGFYVGDTLKVYFTKKDRIKRGSGSWYEGVFEKTGQNFKLKHIEAIPMYGVIPAKYEEKDN